MPVEFITVVEVAEVELPPRSMSAAIREWLFYAPDFDLSNAEIRDCMEGDGWEITNDKSFDALCTYARRCLGVRRVHVTQL